MKILSYEKEYIQKQVVMIEVKTWNLKKALKNTLKREIAIARKN